MNTLEHDYLELITESNILELVQTKKNQLVGEAQAQQIAPEAYLKEHKKDILNLYKKADLGILCNLLDKGHSWRNVTENYTGQPQIIRELDTPEEIKVYTNDVLDMVQSEMNRRTKESFPDAYQAFSSYRDAEESKYQGNTENLKEYIDGQLVIKLLVQDGYSQDTIKKVLKENNYPEDYAKELTEKSMIVKRLYMDIANALPLNQSKNEFDVYRAVAKEYMAKMGIKILSANDDQAIRKQLKDFDFPDKYLHKSFLKASPVAHEPARDSKQYVDAILSDEIEFKEELNQRKPIMDLEGLYKAAIERYDQKLKDTGKYIIDGIEKNQNWRNYYDCLAAKELFDNHYTENEIYNAINRWSPGKDNPAYPGYTQWILDKANKLINKEKDLLNHKKIQLPKASYQDLCDQGFSPTEIVVSILQERIELNPSLKRRLYEPFLDKDLAESALTRYPDFNRDALKGIINSFPRAILLLNTGLAEAKDYADNVIKKADNRIQETNKVQKAKEELKTTFQNQQEIQHQGITGETANMKNDIYTLGRCALTMMQSNNDEHIIRDMIVANLPDADEKIITDIIQKNKECIKRANSIKEYTPPTETKSTATGYYLSQMAKQYKIRNAFNASMDAEIAKDLKIMGHSRNEIKTVIQENSPIICQPGRGSDYVDKYVLPTAWQRAIEELKKLDRYYPTPRQKEAQDIKEEYQYQLKKMLTTIALPFMIEMDVIIAGVLLSQGFNDLDISTTLAQMSPLKDSQKEYGVAIVKAAENDEVRADADEMDNSMEAAEDTNYINEHKEQPQSALIAQETTVETTVRKTFEGNREVASEVIGQKTKVHQRVLRPEGANA